MQFHLFYEFSIYIVFTLHHELRYTLNILNRDSCFTFMLNHFSHLNEFDIVINVIFVVYGLLVSIAVIITKKNIFEHVLHYYFLSIEI